MGGALQYQASLGRLHVQHFGDVLRCGQGFDGVLPRLQGCVRHQVFIRRGSGKILLQILRRNRGIDPTVFDLYWLAIFKMHNHGVK